MNHFFNINLGFVHEHTRPDRDDYIDVDLTKVPSKSMKNFRKVPKLKANTLGQKYDFESILHYIVPGIITPKHGEILKDPSAQMKLSPVDVASIFVLYEDV